ncbi:MAG: DUF3570 domain-containing protein [Opitutales bacterium]|nr:DUF3570 domain-containing protein [Opitutales bacterium]
MRKNTIRFQSKRTSLALFVSIILFVRTQAEDSISVKWQDYSEDDDRIRVISKYIGIDKTINENFAIKAHAVHDAISGATPSGSPDDDGTVPLSNMTDERNSIVADFELSFGTRTTSFQYARSKESDFLSLGYALTHAVEINNRNTRISVGLSYVDDDLFAAFMPKTENKSSTDLFFGVTQVINRNTLFTANLSHGESDGFLSDPYKSILQNTELAPGLFLPLTYQENRPDNRTKDILYFNTKHYFEASRGTLDLGLRFFTDSWGIDSQTLDVEWYQSFGENLRIVPKIRYYRQSGADFYTTHLSNANFTPLDEPMGLFPHYSADYRLAALDTVTYGVKAIYTLKQNIEFDASFERYDMSGRDLDTPESAFPDANVLTLGFNFHF